MRTLLAELKFRFFRFDQRAVGDTEPNGLHNSELAFLRHELCRAPRWIKGHFRLASASLSVGDVETAYASAKAVEKLATDAHWKSRALFLLGRCFLHNGEMTQAIRRLEEAAKLEADDGIKADLGAAYMGEGRYADAERLLSEIATPDQQTAVALRYCQDRLKASEQ